MRPETKLETPQKSDKMCKKCGNDREDELKPAKKGKGFFCIDTKACKERASKK